MFWTPHKFWLLFNISSLFQPVAARDRSQMRGSAGGVWRGCKVKRFAFRLFGLTLLALQVSDWTWAGAHWSGEVNPSQLAKALIRTCRIRPSCFIVFISLLPHFLHDSLLRFAPSGLALLSWCLFWRERLRFIPEFHHSTSVPSQTCSTRQVLTAISVRPLLSCLSVSTFHLSITKPLIYVKNTALKHSLDTSSSTSCLHSGVLCCFSSGHLVLN